ncbi:Vegetative incompatibility protein HET-E-1 [Rhizoctonia solani AG-1 IB]|uniref:Vegetative incompatibility protein HET-E-1 n=1 Tax=Thanatephorus cucumeris (strain AG1-IB / isolate 7/3/14) TaxID=1108050 RepID=M5CGB0_THACB|nr:Vegetative incompatibility protein HET-E-1 [Rhizoctonia solani AG-1 IB]
MSNKPKSKRERIKGWFRGLRVSSSSSASESVAPLPSGSLLSVASEPVHRTREVGSTCEENTTPLAGHDLATLQTQPAPSITSAHRLGPAPSSPRNDTPIPTTATLVAQAVGTAGSEPGPPTAMLNPPTEGSSLQADEAPAPSATSEPTPGMNKAWEALRWSLKKLADTSRAVAPIADAAKVILDCFDTIEAAAKNQEDYQELAAELNSLSETLADQVDKMPSEAVSKCVSGVARGIARQAEEIKNKAERGSERRLWAASSDEEDVVRRYRRIQSLFRQLQANLSMNTWSNTHDLLVDARLQALGPERQATYNSALSTTVGRRTCTKHTRTKVLSDLVSWVYDKNAPAVYWMNGMAGTGKTTIAYSFCEWLEQHDLLAGSFFCTRTSASCKDVARIIPTVVYQLARYSASFQNVLYDILSADPDVGSKSIPNQIESLLKESVQKTLSKPNGTMLDHLVIVIDALDECDDQNGVTILLDKLFELMPQLPLKVFMTSRPEPGIGSKMSAHPGLRQVIRLHDIETSMVRADIELYLKEELGFMSPGLSAEDLEQLVQRSGVLFIYAATLVRYIKPQGQPINSHKRLQSLLNLSSGTGKQHAPIDRLYMAILVAIFENSEREEDEIADIRAVLRTVLFAQEPISVPTIAKLAGIDDHTRVDDALSPLWSVLHLSESGLVSTLHASFPDFIFDQKRSADYFCDVNEHGAELTKRCFGVMKDELRFNICDLPSSFIPDEKVDDLQDRIKKNISASLAYACNYWTTHASLVKMPGEVTVEVQEFFGRRLLFWMEVMSLRQRLLVGLDGLRRVKQWLTRTGPTLSTLRPLIEDAINFYTSYTASPASGCTPHIYISLLPFCPRSSSVYTRYWPRMQGLLYLRGSLMDRRETAALATWDIGSPVFPVAYSPDGSRVAVGCSNGSVSIRNAYDGTLLVGPLQGHTKAVRSVVFSGDGRLVASGSHDRTIRVWDVRSGSLITDPFHGHTDTVNSISFSPDSTRIVSGSDDTTIRVWRATDGALIMDPLQGHTDAIYCVTFSPDGTLIASASHDKTIQLWHSHDGTPAASPLLGHTDPVNCVTFTPDGTRLVSASYDCTVRVWRVSDGSAVTGPFQGHTNWVTSVAVSGDGTLVASGSYDKTVRVWRLDDGTLAAGPFAGHTGAIWSVVYAPDGTRVISGSEDRTMRVWNVREGLVATASSDLPLSEFKWLCFSPDGAHVVTESYDNGIQMWSVTDGTCQPGSVDMRPPSPRLHMSSPDGLYTAQTDEDGDLVQVPPSMEAQ